MVSAELKAKVEARIRQDLVAIKARYGVDLPMPKITYDLTGTTAGKAYLYENRIQLNAGLLTRNVDAFIARTVPHEMAHLATQAIYPEAHQRQVSAFRSTQKRKPHGAQWQEIMRAIGADATRCHSYDVSEVKRKRATYAYECVCGKKYELSSKRHNMIAVHGRRYYHTKCPISGMNPITPVAATALKVAASPAKSPKATTHKRSTRDVGTGQGSKIDRCYGWYQHYVESGHDKATIINVFINEIGCTPAGAQTYFYKCKSMYEKG